MRKKKHITLILVLSFLLAFSLAAVAAFYVWDQQTYQVNLTMQGPEEITLEVGSPYTEHGAAAQVVGSRFEKEPQDVPVHIFGKVNTDQLGEYTLIYSAQFTREHFLGNKQAAHRTQRRVFVVDTQMPVLTLQTQPGSYTLPGQSYQEEGFTASDNYDGDISHLVERVEKDGKVYYTVTDSSGNMTQAEREIFYDDPFPPELQLLGDAVIELIEGEQYQEPGFTATDNVDGDITANVVVTGEVDTQTIGTYTITYTVKDGYDNEVYTQRTVQVNKKPLPPIPDPVGGVIYLTFDDGPSAYTPRLLDILDKYGVKATFFVVGYKDFSLVGEIAARGHAIGNHSYSHNYTSLYASKDAFFNELQACEAEIQKHTGYKTRLLRFPGGSSNSVSRVSMKELTKAVEEAGYFYFDWNVDSKDAGGAYTSEEVFYNVCSAVARRKVSVVLQHDTKGYSVDAVEKIIQWGLANGYTFAALDTTSPGAHHNIR